MTTLIAKHPASALVAVVLAAMPPGTSPSSQPVAQAAATAFIGVNVLPMDKESVLANQTVVVTNGKIASIAPADKAQLPAGAVKVDGKGKPHAGTRRAPRAHSRRHGVGRRRRAHAVSLPRQRSDHDPRHAG